MKEYFKNYISLRVINFYKSHLMSCTKFSTTKTKKAHIFSNDEKTVNQKRTLKFFIVHSFLLILFGIFQMWVFCQYFVVLPYLISKTKRMKLLHLVNSQGFNFYVLKNKNFPKIHLFPNTTPEKNPPVEPPLLNFHFLPTKGSSPC